MGSTFSSLFGGGYKAPEVPQAEPMPDRTQQEAESSAARDEERRRLRSRRNMSGTLLTNPLGGGSANPNAGKANTLLGRTIA